MVDDEDDRGRVARTAAVVAQIDASAASGDWETALTLFLRDLVTLLADHTRWAHGLLSAVPDDHPTDPLLRQIQAFVLGLPGGGPRGDGDARATPEERSVAAVLRVITLRTLGHFDEAECVARSVAPVLARAEAAGVDERLAVARLHFGILRLLRGDLDAATRDLHAANLIATHARSDFVVRNSAGDLALIHALRGDLPTADRWVAVFDGTPANPAGEFERRVRVGGTVAAALTAIGRLRLDEARERLRRLRDNEPVEELWVFEVAARAMLALNGGEAVAGLALLEAGEDGHRNLLADGGIARQLLLATRADLLLAIGQGARARAVLAACDDASDPISLRRARVACVTGELTEAVPLADAVAWRACASMRSRVGAFVTAAQVRWQLAAEGRARAGGLRDEAHRMLGRAVELAGPVGLLQPFALAPREDLLAIADAGPAARRIRAVLEEPALAAVGSALPGRVRVVELSEREVAVLRELATTRSHEVVAKRLFVSPNTVRTQVRNLYRKLDVHSREEALSAAYRQGLLSS